MVRQSTAPGGVGSPGGWCPQSASECLKGWSSSRESTGGLVWERAASAASLAPCARGRQAAARLAASPCRGVRGPRGGGREGAVGCRRAGDRPVPERKGRRALARLGGDRLRQDAPTPWDPERRQESVGTGGGGAAAPCRAAAGGLVKMSPCDLLPVRPSALTYLVFI